MQAAEGSAQEPPLVPLARSDSVSARASLFEAQLKKKEDEAGPKRAFRGELTTAFTHSLFVQMKASSIQIVKLNSK